MFKKNISVLICIAAFALPFTTNAQQQTREELQKQKQQIQKEIDEYNRYLNSIQKDKGKLTKVLSGINYKIEMREKLITNLNKEMKALDDDIYLKQLDIYRLKKELDTLKKNYAQSIVYAYKNRSNYQYLNFIFSANSFNDALKRISYLKSYRRMREDELAKINRTQIDLQKNIEQLNQSKENKKGAIGTQNEQLVGLEQDKKDKEENVKQLRGQEKEINAQISKREKQRQQINKAINDVIKKEALEIAQKEKERLAKIKLEEDAKKKKLADDAAAAKALAAKAKADADAKVNADAAIKAAADEKARRAEEDAKIAQQKSATFNANNNAGKTITLPNGKVRDYDKFEAAPEDLKLSLNFEDNRRRLPWPVATGVICGRFGTQHLTNTMTVVNEGMIFCLPVGTSVKAVAMGEVTSINNFDEYKCVMVRHGKYITVYNRLADVNVSLHQQVGPNTQIGKAAVGDGGEGEFEIQIIKINNNNSLKNLNPEDWLKPR